MGSPCVGTLKHCAWAAAAAPLLGALGPAAPLDLSLPCPACGKQKISPAGSCEACLKVLKRFVRSPGLHTPSGLWHRASFSRLLKVS